MDAISGDILLKEGELKKDGKRTIKLNPLYSILAFASMAVSVIQSYFGKEWTILAFLVGLFLIWELQYGTK